MTATTPAPAGAIITSAEPDTAADWADRGPASPEEAAAIAADMAAYDDWAATTGDAGPVAPVATTDAAPAPARPTAGLTDYVTVLIACDYPAGGPEDGRDRLVAIWSVVPAVGRRARRQAVNRDIRGFIARNNHHARSAGWDHLRIVAARELAVVIGHIELAECISRPPAAF